ncbi:universal stress protein [Streptomyces sp. NPDC006706]|uniref:universal stress protein n=1 Tax=Streptomyces sp. NPDC006706 TaxID=3364761 RepID=UPI003697A420
MGERAVSVARIVVGVDGSGPSEDALRWAARQAALTGAVVEAVTVWEYPMWYGTSALAAGFDFADNAAKILAQALDETFGSDRPVEIRTRVEQGNPAGVLLAASRGAELLVVGNRGHGGFTEALLGSVGQHLVQHAECPVVVIRGPVPSTAHGADGVR